jgi:hypothetical protein
MAEHGFADLGEIVFALVITRSCQNRQVFLGFTDFCLEVTIGVGPEECAVAFEENENLVRLVF